MKDDSVPNEISFILQNTQNISKRYPRGFYCFKKGITHLCFFYSDLEDVWVAVLLNGWIKVDNKKMENEALAILKSQCIIEIDNESFIFFSFTNQTKSASKVVTEIISNSDEKKVSKQDILFYMTNLRNIKDSESYFKILLYNPVFEIENKMIKMNYFIYGMYRYYDIRYLLLEEFKYNMNTGKIFQIIEFSNFYKNFNFLYKNMVHINNEIYNIPEYLYNLVGKNYIKKNVYKDNELFEIFRIWKSIYDLGGDYEKKNFKKNKIDLNEDFNIKKSCKSDEHSGERISEFCTNNLYIEYKLIRDCFTGIDKSKKKSTQRKRSHSLVEDRGSISDKTWMFGKKPSDI